MRVLLLAVPLQFGCNDLLGFGDPTLAMPDADLTRPGCATGWLHRRSIRIYNGSTSALHDYQIKVPVDGAMSGDDIRVMTESGDGPLRHAVERLETLWVNVPTIPVGVSNLDLYYGNPAAEALTSTPFERDSLLNTSFESTGGWTVEQSVGPPASFVMGAPFWSSHGSGSLHANEMVTGERASSSRSAISQPGVFPAGSDYVIRFDINVIAASNGGINGTNDGAFIIEIGNGLNYVWMLTGDHNITGIHLGEETAAFGPGSVPVTFAVRVIAGSGPGYANAYLDNVRVRKHGFPEPTATLGPEQPACSE